MKNPGDRDLRDLERRAAQGDPAAAEALRAHAERVRPRRWLEDFPTVDLAEGDPGDMGLIDSRWRGQWKRTWAAMPYAGGFDPHGETELVIYTDNERDLHDWQTKVGGDLMKKYFKGQYDPMKAWKAWLPIVDAAAKRYREFGGPGARTFNRATRVGAALEIALRFEQQCRFGEERWENLAAEVAASVRPRQRKKNPPSRGDDNLRSLERAYLAGDAAAAHAYNAELFRRGMHDMSVVSTDAWGQPRQQQLAPARVAFYPYAPAGWYVITHNGTWSRASWRTADEAMAAAADMIALDVGGHAYFERNSEEHNARRRDLERRTNHGDMRLLHDHLYQLQQRIPQIPGVQKFYVSFGPAGWIVLDLVVVDPDRRGAGIGTAIMNELVALADQHGVGLALTPTTEFGGSKARLERFYRRWGFVKNSGRSRDFSVKQTMLRSPRASNPAPLAIMGLGPLPAGLLNPAGGEEEYDVLGPGPGEKGKMGKKPKVVETKLKLSEIEGLPGYKEALASYERFHGAKPTHGMALTVDDGKPGHTVKVVVGLGKVPETHYVTPWKSNKKGYHWIHHHPKGGEPFEVLDPVTGITSKIGGTFRVTDWWRK